MLAAMALRTVIHALLPFGADPGVPEWVHLVPAGTFSGQDGRGPYTLANAETVIRASMAAGKLPIDENHAIDLAAKAGGSSPARGWVVEMQARADGIWGRVEWTQSGRALVEDHAYRGISPAFAVTEKGGVVVQVLRAALTNTPNLTQLKTLHTQEHPVDLTKMRRALGLADDADEAAIIAAAEAARNAVTLHAQQVAGIAKAAGLAEDAKPETILVTLNSLRQADPAGLQAQVVQLQSQVATLQQKQARTAAETAVDAAIGAGKPIGAELREIYIERHMANPAAVGKELALLPSLHSGGITNPPKPGAGGDALTDEERRAIELMGVSEADYLAERKKLGLRKEHG